jgi:hypothetical protein
MTSMLAPPPAAGSSLRLRAPGLPAMLQQPQARQFDRHITVEFNSNWWVCLRTTCRTAEAVR